MKMKKKGFLGDYVLFPIILLAFALFFGVLWYVINTYNTAWQATPDIGTQPKSMFQTFTGRFVGVYDNFFFFLMIGYVIAIVIVGFALRSHPVFAMLAVGFMIIMGMIGVYFANAYHDVSISPELRASFEAFTYTNHIMTYLPHIIIIFFVIFIIIMFSKSNQGIDL